MAKRGKNAYRLQIVLDQREKVRDDAAVILQEKRELLKKEREEEERLKNELAANRQRKSDEYDRMIADGLRGGLLANGAQGRLNYLKRLDHLAKILDQQISDQKKRVARAEREVEEALAVLIQASRELQVMKNHKDRWTKKMKLAEEALDQKEANEIGNVMYNANRRKENAERRT